MGKSWTDGLPIVAVPISGKAKQVTIILPYYENAAFFGQQWREWKSYSAELMMFVSVIVVDDGSPEPLRHPAPHEPETTFRFRAFRIEEDRRWNWLAARNIGAHHADTDWLLLTDMDHVVPEPTMRMAIYGKHDPNVVYAFQRKEHTGEWIGPHSASFLMTKAMFWKIGGYDEALSGHYGTDGEYRRRVAKFAPFKILSDYLIRYEYVGDSSTTRYKRKQPEDARVSQIVRARGPKWRPRVLSFPYHEVTA